MTEQVLILDDRSLQGLQRALDVQRLVHNWVRPHWSLVKGTTKSDGNGVLQSPRVNA